ncbi:hypothetical protein HYH03_010553 [Edaphochlamys debaryana]|uniref:BACK domain-containing protein n=1 Tax=Edaphochlamys debaryana TaxID=47281 RepID=A0A836BXF3_9CHLO|nr:hypothetical protein HYH03_010553 [Edaphochlamys debaryana]|eukprot:KAG2491109.1 hypothetical protein HYH03_010553 [Edaphochlamys debaryana]
MEQANAPLAQVARKSAGNPHFASAVAEAYGQQETSDCDVVFYRERHPAAKRQRVDPEATRAETERLDEDSDEGEGAASKGLAEPEVFGSPLPAHTFVMRFASKRLAAQIERWGTVAGSGSVAEAQREPAADGAGPSSSSSGAGRKRPHPEPGSAPDGRPVLRVPVADEAEAEAGRLAIRFAYTGEVAACSIRQALETMRVADYLEIKGCGAACVECISQQLLASGEGSAGSVLPADPPVLQFYGCSGLWPDSLTEPAFAAVLASAKPALVRHFGDTLAALNRPALRDQLRALPAAGIEALLESEDFGTDSEDSILTLLAVWMRVNWERTDAATRKRLSGLVRLAQLSSYAAACFLSALSVDFELKGEDHPAGWFPVRAAHSSLVAMYASSLAVQQKYIRKTLPFPAWCNMNPRPQCVPAEGLCYEWTVTRDALKAALKGVTDSGRASVYAKFEGNYTTILSRGIAFEVGIFHTVGTDKASLSLGPVMPMAYQEAAPPDPLARWAPYLHEGKIRGRLVLLPVGARRDRA